MTLKFARLRTIFRPGTRSTAACPAVLMDAERTDREIALLAKAEREYQIEDWQRRSVLGSR